MHLSAITRSIILIAFTFTRTVRPVLPFTGILAMAQPLADQYPWHFYTHPGTYDVCLTVADTSGVTCTKCDTVIIGAVATCSAAFNYYSLNNPDSLHFYATSTTGIANWYWNFGDGTTSTLEYPWHHFATSGTYNVCLTVVDSSGATCTYLQQCSCWACGYM